MLTCSLRYAELCNVYGGCLTACPGRPGLLGFPNSLASAPCLHSHAKAGACTYRLLDTKGLFRAARAKARRPRQLRRPDCACRQRAPPAPSSALNGCKQKAELLFVHTADAAELTAAADGALTLVLRNVSRFTTYFTGARPAWIQAWPQGCQPEACLKNRICWAAAGPTAAVHAQTSRSGGRAPCTPRRSTPTRPSSRAGTPAGRGWAGPNAALYGLRGDTVRAAGLPCDPAAACFTHGAQAGLKLT